MGASGPPNTRTSATACVYGLQLRGSLFGQVHIPTGVDRWNLGTSPPAGLLTLTVVAQEQKAVLAKLFNHSEKQTNAQVGHLATPRSDSLSLDFGHFSGADPRSARVPWTRSSASEARRSRLEMAACRTTASTGSCLGIVTMRLPSVMTMCLPCLATRNPAFSRALTARR